MATRHLKTTWLDAYLKYTEETESPDNYKLWSGIHAVSAALKKHVFMRRDYDIYANQYIVLVGPPGIGKGQAMKPAIELVKKSGTGNYLPDRITAEKICDRLANGFTGVNVAPSALGAGAKVLTVGDSSATIVSTELPILISTSDWMLPLLCDLWDRGEFSYDTKTKGSLSATGICAGMFGGCVPDYIRKINKDAMAAVTGGFSSRCLFVFADKKSKTIPWPHPQTGTQLETDLLEDLKNINRLRGEMRWTDSSKKRYTQFYEEVNDKAEKLETEVERHFNSRIISHAIKASMVFSISESDSLALETHHLDNAIVLVNSIQDTIGKIFRGLGESPLAGMIDRVLSYLENRPGGIVRRAELMKNLRRHMTDDQLTLVLRMLIDSEEIKIASAGSSQIITLNHLPKRKP